MHVDPTILRTEHNLLEGRINNFVRVVSSLDITNQNYDCQRSLLLTRTLLYCSSIQLLVRVCRPRDEKYVTLLHAALSAVDSLKTLNLADFVCVDPVLGVSLISLFCEGQRVNASSDALGYHRSNAYRCFESLTEYLPIGYTGPDYYSQGVTK